MASAYDFSFTTIKGEPYPLSQHQGKPLLLVNTASQCGFTPQYKALEAVWKAHANAGLTVIGLPCNDFGGQEPGSAAQISQFCELNYGVTFPIMAKLTTKGPDAHPFFDWAVSQAGFMARPRWNFYKFLINKQGALETYFMPTTSPDSSKFTRVLEVLID